METSTPTYLQSLIHDSRQTFRIPKKATIGRRDTSEWPISHSWEKREMLRLQYVNTIIFISYVIFVSDL